MVALQKGTKLTDTPKDYMLRVRLDEETLQMLDELCTKDNLSRSAFVRQCIVAEYRNK